MRRLLFVVATRPDDLEAAFCLKLDNGDVEFLIKDDRRLRVGVCRRNDLRYALVQ